MADIVNLNRKRKEAVRREQRRQVAENRVRFGLTKTQRQSGRSEAEKARKKLTQKQLEPKPWN
jgi:Domain of unknown function (DUF4169)